MKYLRKLLAGPLDGSARPGARATGPREGSARPGGARPDFGTGGLYNNNSYIS